MVLSRVQQPPPLAKGSEIRVDMYICAMVLFVPKGPKSTSVDRIVERSFSAQRTQNVHNPNHAVFGTTFYEIS